MRHEVGSRSESVRCARNVSSESASSRPRSLNCWQSSITFAANASASTLPPSSLLRELDFRDAEGFFLHEAGEPHPRESLEDEVAGAVVLAHAGADQPATGDLEEVGGFARFGDARFQHGHAEHPRPGQGVREHLPVARLKDEKRQQRVRKKHGPGSTMIGSRGGSSMDKSSNMDGRREAERCFPRKGYVRQPAMDERPADCRGQAERRQMKFLSS